MANAELVEYIKSSLEAGHSHASIARELMSAGWSSSEVNAAFSDVERIRLPPLPRKGFSGSSGPEIPVSAGSGTGYHEKFFRLNQGEGITFECKPLRGLLWYMLVTNLIGIVIFGIFLLPLFLIPLFVMFSTGTYIYESLSPFVLVSIVFTVLYFVYVAVSLILVKRRYNMRYYWITSQRIIVKEGTIGYSIHSIPLERISDVAISRSFMERLFGFGSLRIQSLSGQITYVQGSRMGSEGNLQAVPNPEETQALIFRLVKERREKAHLTF